MEAHVERLLGQQVIDSRGRRVGRIEEIRADSEGPVWIVRSYVLGLDGFIERLAAGAIAQALLGPLARRRRRRRTIDWDELDLSDPERPRLRPARDGQRAGSGSRG
jgi:hypothetical protein